MTSLSAVVLDSGRIGDHMNRWIALSALFAGLLLQLCSAHDDEASGNPVVRTHLGAVTGTTMTSRSGRTFFSFRGLRYAKPPVGELRFKPPVPITESWDGVINATEDAASCPQPSGVIDGPKSEDCLFLNVYTPKLPEKETNVRFPVIFFIHFGGWYGYSAQSSLLGPQYFMDEDVVLVTINYRLGALGFLSTGDSVVPGNNGLKDQLLAMKWVRDNIASFGGDPNLVTLYGYSAGGASVQYHMASPRSAGLFHRAISGSGSPLSGWAAPRDGMTLTRRLAKIMNCPDAETATSKQIVDFLKGRDADEISKAYLDMREWQYDPLIIFAPVIEAEGGPEDPFLIEDPDLLFQTGNFTQVPWMTGSTNNEMMLRAAEILQNETVLEDLSKHFERIAPIALYYERGTPSSLQKSRKLKEFYFPGGPITNNSRQQITDIYTDAAFLRGVDRSVKLISTSSRSPVYYYQFVYRGRYGHMDDEPGMDKRPGPVHHDDLIYLFFEDGVFPLFTDEFPEANVSKRLVRIFANFARTGNPTPDTGSSNDGLITTTWKPHTPTGLEYLEIGDELTMKRALRQERAAVWDDIYPTREATDRSSSVKVELK